MQLGLVLTFLILFSMSTLAQVDVSTEMLLQSHQVSTEEAVESGRYQIRGPASKKNSKGQLPSKSVKSVDDEYKIVLQQSTSVVVPEMEPVATTSTTVSTTLRPRKMTAPSTTTTTTTSTTTTTLPVIVEQPTITDQVKDLVADKDQPLVEAYKEQIHPDDTRLNQLEIDVLSGVVANSAASNYSFRNYNTVSPQISIGGKLWMTPFLGLHGQYRTSLGADVISDGATSSRISVQHETTEFGFQLRRYFGMSRKANSLQYGLFFSEYRFVVPSNDNHRVRLRSSGLGINLSGRIPVAPGYAWVFAGKLIPRVQHQEQPTGISLSSGDAGESSRFDLSLGGEFKMARQSQIIWDLTVSHEKNQFGGQASHPDPETGQRPNGVSVSNTLTIFSLGYRWGQ